MGPGMLLTACGLKRAAYGDAMLRLLSVVLCLSFPVAATASCDGNDMIAILSDNDRATLADRTAATPFPNGLLWRADKGDTVITLFGTYHFGSSTVQLPSPFQKCDCRFGNHLHRSTQLTGLFSSSQCSCTSP